MVNDSGQNQNQNQTITTITTNNNNNSYSKITEFTDESCELLEWFSDFEDMDSALLQDGCQPIDKSKQPSISFKNLDQFIKYLEENNCVDDIEVSPCSKSHTFNRPVADPRLIIKPTWCVYGNSLNTEFFYSCLKDKHCGDIIVDHFEPLVSDPNDFLLSKGGQRIFDTPNAGGNSVWSEVLAYEVLNQVFGAQLKKTETEIEYAPNSKITDFSIDIKGSHIGVSVVRIINFFDLNGKTFKAQFTPEFARNLLYKKLFGVIASSEAVVDKWEKQILYIWTTSSCVADIIVQEYWNLPSKLRSNTLVYVTHATGSEWLF